MRRHRFGGIAVALAAVYLAAVVGLGVIAMMTGDITPVWGVVIGQYGFVSEDLRPWWWLLVLLVLIAAVQAWAYWQVLRGRERGEPVQRGGEVRLLRVALYLNVGYNLVARLPIPYGWWFWLVGVPLQLAVAWLFFRVLRDTAPRWLRLLVLVTGIFSVLVNLGVTLEWALGADLFIRIPALDWIEQFAWPLWMVAVLLAQARDPRWSGTTVRVGVIALVMSFVQPSGIIGFGYVNEISWRELFLDAIGALSFFGLVWWARSAHDLGSVLAPSSRPPRAPARRWPLPVVAITLPLLPAVVNLAHGVPFWLGPKNAVWNVLREFTSFELTLAWYVLDLLVGVGVPSLLILVAVWRRTYRLTRATTLTLFFLAGVAVVSASTTADSSLLGELQLYPSGLFVKDGTLVSAGISPLWYGLALTGSALTLTILYGAPPARRTRRQVLLVSLAVAVTLCFIPAADQARGPVITAQECDPPERWELEPRELTAEQKFVCSLRQPDRGLRRFSDTTPDQVVIAYGRWMCELYTRDDPRELARWKVNRAALTYPLAGICPRAAAVVNAERAEQDRELAEMQADAQRMCDATPHHRPRVKPAKAIRMKEPQWTDYGVLQTYEDEEAEAVPDLDPGNGLVSTSSGTLTVLTHSDFDICVTVETYSRRPPVETKGWDKVVEVGYRSPTGEIVLTDSLSGTTLPDLSLNGRSGRYRIRVHYAWFPWKGEEEAGQRLLIMAYPSPGDKDGDDKEIVYRR
ncbi:hypothetical protein [Streptosporangium saharense]|uniref:Uncharacterized protein n=1 Tax=Streptosporangium saharense TaxID=1706840 RepID=A0A7W7QMU1_9ACTN|nr:hypothetical protein [Streptosporangium saharense]MBB4916413.1 hypothetical protein [Streptosporangium saharense]